MEKQHAGRFAVVLSASVYFLIALEILIMISPFAAYFYSAYGPVLTALSENPWLGWSAEFFLPHMVFTRDPLIVAVSSLQFLFVVGLILFLLAAVPLYYTRIFKRCLATGGLYSRVRHPQYLALAVSGLGLLIYWPRFIILVLYVTMLFTYYLLARNEEWRMKRAFGVSYEEYLKKTPMFLPGEPGGRVYQALFGKIRRQWLGIALLYALVLCLSIGSALAIRAYSVGHVQKVESAGTLIVPAFERPEEEVQKLYDAVRTHEAVKAALDKSATLAYLMPGDYFLMALVTDEPRRFTDEVIASFPEILEWHRHKFGGGPGRFFRIFFGYAQTLWTSGHEYDVERVIFVSVRDRQGRPVKPADALDMGLRRTAELIVDVDAKTREVLLVKKLSGGHKWGTIPMPAF